MLNYMYHFVPYSKACLGETGSHLIGFVSAFLHFFFHVTVCYLRYGNFFCIHRDCCL